MWEAAKANNSENFLKLVDENAIMVCGGYRCTGREYAEIIKMFDCKNYEITDFEIVAESNNFIQVHYIIKTEINNEESKDLAGKFHITSTWVKNNKSRNLFLIWIQEFLIKINFFEIKIIKIVI